MGLLKGEDVPMILLALKPHDLWCESKFFSLSIPASKCESWGRQGCLSFKDNLPHQVTLQMVK